MAVELLKWIKQSTAFEYLVIWKPDEYRPNRALPYLVPGKSIAHLTKVFGGKTKSKPEDQHGRRVQIPDAKHRTDVLGFKKRV